MRSSFAILLMVAVAATAFSAPAVAVPVAPPADGEAPPAAVAVWHVDKPLPEELDLNGPELRRRVEALLAADRLAAVR
jgi:hypothetical protein